jgi:hypothetical protein
VRAQERRQRARHAGQHALFLALRGLLAGLEPLPLFDHGTRRARLAPRALGLRQRPAGRREDVRMATDELLGHEPHCIGEIEPAGLGGNLRLKHALEEHVPELAAERVEIAAVDGVERLVRLFEQERPQRLGRLFAIPRTALSRSQRVHRADQSGACRGGAAGAIVDRVRARLPHGRHGTIQHLCVCCFSALGRRTASR